MFSVTRSEWNSAWWIGRVVIPAFVVAMLAALVLLLPRWIP